MFASYAGAQAIAPTPVISPAPGDYRGPLSVSISDSLAGASILYWENFGLESAAVQYTDPFLTSEFYPGYPWIAVEAIATAAGYQTGAAASAVYTVNNTNSTISINGGDPYTMSCTVLAPGGVGEPGPTGTATFTDVTTSQTLGTALLGTPASGRTFGWLFSVGRDGIPLLADFNGDKKIDLAAVAETGVEISMGNGDGTFHPGVFVSQNTKGSKQPIAIAAGDFAGNGRQDIVFTMTSADSDPKNGTDNLTSYGIIMNNGDGTFQAPVYDDAGAPLASVATGDFNGDGIDDLVFTETTPNWGCLGYGTCSAPDQVLVAIGKGDGTFRSPVAYSVGELGSVGYFHPQIIVGDFNGDKKLDAAVINFPYGGNTPEDTVSVLLGNGDGTFQPQMVTPTFGQNLQEIQAADFNNDGRLDLAVLDENSKVWILLGNGDGTFQYNPNLAVTVQSREGFGVGDYYGNGIPGLYIQGSEQIPGSSISAVYYASLNGDGTFSSSIVYSGSSWPSASRSGYPQVVDFNGDGYLDLLLGEDILMNELEWTASGSTGTIVFDPGNVTIHEFNCSYAGDANYQGSTSTSQYRGYTQVAPPVLSLLVGVYNAPQTVTITDAVSGAAIYYTTDGSPPTASSTRYTGPITISSPTTFKTIGVETGYFTSVVSEASYLFAATPHVSPAPGTYPSAQSVTIDDSTPGATIYYTTDGSAPTTHSAIYSGAINMNASANLQAMATAPNYLNSAVASGTYTISGSHSTTSTVLQSSLASANENQQVTLTVTVTGSNSPTGTVTFKAGSTTLGTAMLSNGTATLQTSFSTAGSYQVTASYGGDASNSGSLSGTVTINVIAPSYSASANPTTQTIKAGQSATFQITVTPAGGYSSAVSFSCTGLPAEAACTFNPTSVTPNGGPVSTTLTISTTVATANLERRPAPWLQAGGLTLAGALGLFLRVRRRRMRWSCLLGIVLLSGVAAGVTSCGGSGGAGGGGNTQPGTPTGPYSVSVSASAASGAGQALQLTLNVN